ncbi:hypothetical protein FHW79_001477 [Azospirillum sp. OGB3]|uniref:DUF4399 domain-containing protein n=2 Tax=Azospirillum TaxID=191 RepID=UPI001605B857|nr:DUF4399 domain-containing protein [Azospirillum sp. OGB3]MBB3263881.1 hypothetical protein [Azospirillum sp. OGB3]
MPHAAMIVAAALLLLPGAASAQSANAQSTNGREKAPEGARAYIMWPSNGTTISGGKLWVRMGLQNMGIAPAGIRKEDTGHHHLLVDSDLATYDEPIPNTKQSLHFGGGQTEVRLELPPGRHTLQMILGDADHVPHDPPIMSQKITIIVPQ